MMTTDDQVKLITMIRQGRRVRCSGVCQESCSHWAGCGQVDNCGEGEPEYKDEREMQVNMSNEPTLKTVPRA